MAIREYRRLAAIRFIRPYRDTMIRVRLFINQRRTHTRIMLKRGCARGWLPSADDTSRADKPDIIMYYVHRDFKTRQSSINYYCVTSIIFRYVVYYDILKYLPGTGIGLLLLL